MTTLPLPITEGTDMKTGGEDTETLIDLLRAPTTSRADALRLLDAVCRTAYSEGLVAGSRATGDIINNAFGAVMGERP